MGGIVGVYAFGGGRERWRVARFLYYGLLALQHRGWGAAAMALLSADGLRALEGRGEVEEALGESVGVGVRAVEAAALPGYAGIGSASRGAALFNRAGIAVAGDGAPEGGWDALAEALAEALGRDDPAGGVVKVLEGTDGAYSFVALSSDGRMAAARDPNGSLPLEVGSMGFDMGAVASESAALEVMGMEHRASVRPGEVLLMDRHGVEVARASPRPINRCSFEYVYMARHDSVLDGLPVYAVRERIGEVLAEEAPADADAVIGVPETALPVAAGYSMASGIPLEVGFVSTGRRVRTAGMEAALDRLVGVQLKLNPVAAAVDGRDVVLVDDSVVRGTTLRNVVWTLRRKGARAVHVRIGSPPLVNGCPIAAVPRPDELIASDLSEGEIADVVGADSLRFLSLKGLARALGVPDLDLDLDGDGGFCTRCWRRAGTA